MTVPRVSRVLPLLALSVLLAGCDLVGDVLELGFWAIVVLALVLVSIILWAVRKFRGPGDAPPPPPQV